MPESAPKIFEGCVISIIPSRDIDVLQLQSSLEAEGAEVLGLSRDGSVDLERVSHIISTHIDFPQYDQAIEQMTHVVKPSWITLSLLRNKTVPIRPHTPDPRLIFSGVNITTADIPTNDKDAIIGAVVAMGGQESSNLTKLTTHIVALSMDSEKVQYATSKASKCKIIAPHWFDDCLRLGKRIDEAPYLLPNPEIFEKGADEDIKIPSSQHLDGAIETKPKFIESKHGPHRKLDVFMGKKIMLAADLQLGSRLRAIIEDLIDGGGGFVTKTIAKADIFVCHYRDGQDYITASQAGIDVGNLAWLYHLISHNQWTSPFRRLLHYPIPRRGIPGFEHFKITLSNYGGEARIYLENLVTAAGGEFTKSMKQDNTHLITARIASEKCDAAQEWNIHMVNHLWIEESYARCAIQSMTNPRYTHFPPRTNLGEVIGQTHFNKEALEELFFPQSDPTSPARYKSPKKIMQDKNSNLPAFAVPPRRTTSTPAKSAVGTPQRIGGKENETPSSRGAKDRAMSRLSDLAPDIALYEKEKKRSDKGVWGGKRAADQVERLRDEENAHKRSSSPTSGLEEDEEHDAKRQKTSKSGPPAVVIRLCVTSFPKWQEKVASEEQDRKKLRSLGILVVQDPLTCTHLAAPSIVRTQKFLTAVSAGAEVLSTTFIDKCLESDTLPKPDKFKLKDVPSEHKFNIKLNQVIARAKVNQKRLLSGMAVYCTSDVSGGVESYKAIVEANGGYFATYRGRAVIRPSKEGEIEPTDGEPVYLLSGTKPSERALWPKFEQMVRDGKMEPRVVSTEWLLTSALGQQAVWKDEWLHTDA